MANNRLVLSALLPALIVARSAGSHQTFLSIPFHPRRRDPAMTALHRDAPRILGPLPGPRATAWLARDDSVMSPSYTRVYPLVVRRARGAMIEDVDGNRFLDFTAGIAVTAAGHCHPRVISAVRAQAG